MALSKAVKYSSAGKVFTVDILLYFLTLLSLCVYLCTYLILSLTATLYIHVCVGTCIYRIARKCGRFPEELVWQIYGMRVHVRMRAQRLTIWRINPPKCQIKERTCQIFWLYGVCIYFRVSLTLPFSSPCVYMYMYNTCMHVCTESYNLSFHCVYSLRVHACRAT